MTGTFGGTLESRKVRIEGEGLVGVARGEVELEGNVLVIKRIHVLYRLVTPAEDKEKVDRAYGLHADNCPVYRSLRAAISITTELGWRESGT
ncbi:MAG: OsmC family protein [Desulfuromonadaceae bacterium]